ncbi:uncharacterized protein cnp [Genypterus blacodes]|uniref:uncharacterized protein cnp n=1 Tax=Genypterus blacodes TaxID=154954 RepID=UPI003F777BB3
MNPDMDTEASSELVEALSESPQQEEIRMENEVESKPETPEESAEPEKSPAAAEVNAHNVEAAVVREAVEVVTENVQVSEEEPKVEMKDGVSEEKKLLEEEQGAEERETVSDAVQPPEPDESLTNIPDPVTVSKAELDNNEPEQQPAPENIPAPAPLAKSDPEPEPEKLAEPVPEAETPQQQIPEPDTPQPPVEPRPPSPEEKVDTEVELLTATPVEELVKEVVAKSVKEVAEEKLAEVEMEREAETVMVTEVGEEKLTEAVAAEETPEKPAENEKEAEPEKPAESEKEAEAKKPAESEKEAETEKPAEPKSVKAEMPAGCEVVPSEQETVELKPEEVTAPAPGSLSFAILEHEQTKCALQTSRTLIVLRGLPGSGKSFLARAIAADYKDHCCVLSADDLGVKLEDPESSAAGYKAVDEAVVARCGAGVAPVLIVVDDTNHTHERLGRMGELAKQHRLVVMFMEPRTEWSRDASQLAKRSGRGLEEAQIETIRGPLADMSIPLFFGWFLLSTCVDKVKCTSMDFLKTLDTLEAFKKHPGDFNGKAEKEVDLEQYFKAKGSLHCTTKFCNYGKAEGAKEYAEQQAVADLYGSVFELSLSALFVTPRTVGARVSLSEEQLVLWPADAEKEAEATVPGASSLPPGSRAHITLGCAEGVEPVQTGLDLLDILALQQAGQQGEPVTEMELGSLAFFGEGRWLLSLREPICVPACFSSFYKPKKHEETKKEPEKKKKQKCTIL